LKKCYDKEILESIDKVPQQNAEIEIQSMRFSCYYLPLNCIN